MTIVVCIKYNIVDSGGWVQDFGSKGHGFKPGHGSGFSVIFDDSQSHSSIVSDSHIIWRSCKFHA